MQLFIAFDSILMDKRSNTPFDSIEKDIRPNTNGKIT